MHVSKIVLKTVGDYLKSGALEDEGVIADQVFVLPERIVPPVAGQDIITVSGESLIGISPKKNIRRKEVTFSVSLSRRIKDVPEDRRGEIAYLGMQHGLAMASIMEVIAENIESLAMFNLLSTENDNYPIDESNAQEDEDPADYPSKWLIDGSFSFLSLNLDPVHLYHSDFWTRTGNAKQELEDKVAGFRMTAVFTSPYFSRRYNPLECGQLPFDTGSSSSS